MNSDNVSWLTTVPASDCNFKSHLKSATVEEIKEAIFVLSKNEASISKLNALERELRRRVKDEKSEN